MAGRVWSSSTAAADSCDQHPELWPCLKPLLVTSAISAAVQSVAMRIASLAMAVAAGSLPPAWGAQGAFSSLKNLAITGNRISGKFPPFSSALRIRLEWKQHGSAQHLGKPACRNSRGLTADLLPAVQVLHLSHEHANFHRCTVRLLNDQMKNCQQQSHQCCAACIEHVLNHISLSDQWTFSRSESPSGILSSGVIINQLGGVAFLLMLPLPSAFPFSMVHAADQSCMNPGNQVSCMLLH